MYTRGKHQTVLRTAITVSPVNQEYKKQNMETWNELAPRYHKRWAGKMLGPLQSAVKLIEDVEVKNGDTILDVACGTGLVTSLLSQKVGKTGTVVGADISSTAIRIAMKENKGNRNVLLINADAENVAFARKFDIVTCQYALFFFPDAPKALKNMRGSLKESGRIGIVVHGSREKTPFFGAILDAAEKFIPDYTPENTPRLDRYATKQELREEIEGAGFSSVNIREYIFEYSPGTFDAYWRNYLRYAPKTIRAKIDGLGRTKRREFREEVRHNSAPYTDQHSRIVTFPWQALVLTAMP